MGTKEIEVKVRLKNKWLKTNEVEQDLENLPFVHFAEYIHLLKLIFFPIFSLLQNSISGISRETSL